MPRLSPITVWLSVLVMLALVAWIAMTSMQRTVEYDSPEPQVSTSPLPDMRIDLNSADAAQLSMLPGLGPMLAERIIESRKNEGLFTSVDDLERVSGIGPSILERLRPYAFVSRK